MQSLNINLGLQSTFKVERWKAYHWWNPTIQSKIYLFISEQWLFKNYTIQLIAKNPFFILFKLFWCVLFLSFNL